MTTLLTLPQAAQRLGVSVRTVEREAADGRLALVRIRSRRMVDPAELTRYIAAASSSTSSPTGTPSCPSASEVIATRSASALAAASALSEHFLRGPRGKTPARSKSRLAARASTLRLVDAPDT